jgi:hypothetical protein
MALILWYLIWGSAVIKHVMAQTGEACYSRAMQENTLNLGGFVNDFVPFIIIKTSCYGAVEFTIKVKLHPSLLYYGVVLSSDISDDVIF